MGADPTIFRVATCGDESARVATCTPDETRVRGCGGREVAADVLMAVIEIDGAANSNFYFEDTTCGMSGSGRLIAMDVLEQQGAPAAGFNSAPSRIFAVPRVPCAVHTPCDDGTLRDPCRVEPYGHEQFRCGLLNGQSLPFCLNATGVYSPQGLLIEVAWTGECELYMLKNIVRAENPDTQNVHTYSDCCGWNCGETHQITYADSELYNAHPNAAYNVWPHDDICNVGEPVAHVGRVTVTARLSNPFGLTEPINVEDWFNPPAGSNKAVQVSFTLNWAASGRLDIILINSTAHGFGAVTMSGHSGGCLPVLNGFWEWVLPRNATASYTAYVHQCWTDPCARCLNHNDWPCGGEPNPVIPNSIDFDVECARVRFA